MKKVLSLILVAVMVMSMFAGLQISSSALEPTGKCGDNVYWSFDESTGTLTISGTGDMYDFELDYVEGIYPPFYYAGDNLKEIIIENGVTKIGVAAFASCGCESVSISNTVTSISDYAFIYCYRLTSVTIPDSVTSIGESAFSDCSSLKSVTIGESVRTIEKCAFAWCSELISVNIPDSVTYVGTQAFDDTGYYNDRSNWVGLGVLYIDNWAIAGLSSISSCTIKNGTIGIAGSAFSDCKNATTLIIPDSVKYIGEFSFAYCAALTTVSIPDSVVSMGDYTFAYCEKLESVEIGDSLTHIPCEAFYGDDNLRNVNFGASVTTIGDEAFYSCNISDLTIPASIISIGKDAFRHADLERITVVADNKVFDSRNNCNAIIETASNKLIIGCINSTIPNSVTSIGDGAFYACYDLTAITIPDSVEIIDQNAFYGCSKLKSIDIPDSVTNIGAKAFECCGDLTEINLSASLTNIGEEAFCACAITSINIPDSVTSIANSTFYDCKNLETIKLPYSVKNIGEKAFSGCYSLKNVLFTGTEEQWNSITIGDGNSYLTRIEVRYNYVEHEHNYDNGVVTEEANCYQTGEKVYTCSVCGLTKKETLPINNNHDFNNGYCTRCGVIDPKSNIPAITGNCKKTVNVESDKKYYTSFTPAEDGKITFYSTGSKDTMGYLYSADMVLLESDDDSGDNNNFKITYDVKSGQKYILACNIYYGSGNLNFTFEYEPDLDPDNYQETVIELEYGDYLYPVEVDVNLDGVLVFYSSKCTQAQLYDSNSNLLASVNNSGTENGFYLTYPVKAGNTYIVTCFADLGDATIFIKYPHKHTHSYSSSVTTQPTCTQAGLRTFTCECGDTYTQPIPALGHDFSDNAEVCRRGCGTVNPDYIPPVPAHVHDYKAVVTAPKANAVGYTQYKCSCGEWKKDAKGNVLKEKFTAPTGKPAGFKCASRTATAEKFTWTKTSGVNGYQVQLLNSAGKSAGSKVLAGNAYTFTKLASGHAYKARVRFFIKAADGKNYYGAWATIVSPTLPAATSLVKVTGAKKAFTAQWKKGAVTGYQLQYATNNKFSGAKTVTIKKAAALKYTVSKLAANKTFYVRIRTYKAISGANYYSTWSGAKSVKTK